MASLRELYQLTHSLSKAEKRSLTLFVNGLGGKAKDNYLQQLDNILSLTEYNEALLKEKMANIETKRISEFNTNLFDFICNALILISKETSPAIEIQKQNILSEILVKRKLLSTAQKLNKKTIESKKLDEIHHLQAQAYRIQQSLNKLNRAPLSEQVALQAAKIESLEKSKSESLYLKLNYEMNMVFVQNPLPRREEELKVYTDLLSSDLLQNFDLAVSKNAKHFYYMIKIPLLMIMGRNEEAIATSTEAIEFAKNNFDVKKNPTPLFLQLKRSFNLQFSFNDFTRLEELLEQMKALIKLNPHLENNIDIQTVALNVQMSKSLLKKQYKEGVAYFEQYAKKDFEERIESIVRLDAKALLVARVYFLNGNFKEALYYAELGLKSSNYKFKTAVIAAEFLILMCHYQLKNHLLLPYAAKALHRSLELENFMYSPEKALLSFLSNIKDPGKMKQGMKKLRKVFEKEIEKPLNQSFFANGDYLQWLNDAIVAK